MVDSSNIIAFQGVLGAYSHMSCQAVRPSMEVLPCISFEEMILSVQEGRAALAMVPVENSIAGRVADIHHILPGSGLIINGEHFQRVNHQLLAPRGATLDDLVEVHSHAQGLAQCRERLQSLGLRAITHSDTAGAAKDIAARGDKRIGAIASALAGEIYDLDVLVESAEDAEHNTTRFLIMSKTGTVPPLDSGRVITTMVFKLRSVPAALYKALGGFATNGINITKLESYIRPGFADHAQFYIDVEGHIDGPDMKLAIEELCFYCENDEVTNMGTYLASPDRTQR
ncbi:MAG: prephenate dehydratase [Bacteroidetes bacterium]|jgi:prephenate dehydratase|nr:prephenate dehydratase [Bacteroidota bacterium]